jgi:hypothetical protein
MLAKGDTKMHRIRRSVWAIAAGIMAIALSVGSASAVPITLSGGFTSFTGQASGAAGNGSFPPTSVSPGCISEYQAFVDGINVVAASCPPPVPPALLSVSGAASLMFPSTVASFEFYATDFGNCCGLNPAHNALGIALTPTQNVGNIDDPFPLGTFTFTNGLWFGTSTANSFHINITAGFPDPIGTQTLSDDIVMQIRVGSTPADNADCIFFSHFTVIGNLCVNEGDTTTATLLGKHGSLIPTGWTNVQGGFVLGAAPAAVPEPTPLVLLVAGGLAAIWMRRRRR